MGNPIDAMEIDLSESKGDQMPPLEGGGGPGHKVNNCKSSSNTDRSGSSDGSGSNSSSSSTGDFKINRDSSDQLGKNSSSDSDLSQ